MAPGPRAHRIAAGLVFATLVVLGSIPLSSKEFSTSPDLGFALERSAITVGSGRGVEPFRSGLGTPPCGWQSGFHVGDLDGIVDAFAVFDDGTGPALYVGGSFTAASGIPVYGIAKWDGSSWSSLAGPSGTGVNGGVRALEVFNDGSGPALYVGGSFSRAGGVAANSIAKWDGASWSALSHGVNGPVYALTVFDDGSGPGLYAGGAFLTAGGASANRIAKWNGSVWRFLAGPLGNGVSGTVSGLAVFDDGSGAALYAGGSFSTAGGVTVNSIARWDGAAWSTLAGPAGTGLVGSAADLAVFDDGSGAALYAGGSFTTAGGVTVDNIAKWNGSEWSALTGPSGTGTSDTVLALTVFDDGSGAALYAGGSFTLAGGVTVNRIAMWNGSDWSALTGPSGTGASGAVYSLGKFDDGSGAALYAGGGFWAAGGETLNSVARWNGIAWSPLAGPSGAGVHSYVQALTVRSDLSSSVLYAGGIFTTAGGEVVNRIAGWDGEVWSDLTGPSETGVDEVVSSLTVFDDGGGLAVYAGGYFATAGGVPVSNIARWDGGAWSALAGPSGVGVNGTVEALAVFDDGEGAALYAGGNFTTAGGVTVNGIARWNGSAWSALAGPAGTGVSGSVEAMVVFDDGSGPALFVGGVFGTAGGVEASWIAKWDGSAWSALEGPSGTELTGGVEALAVFEDTGGAALYAGGGFPTAGGATVNGIARWDGSTWSALAGPSGTGVNLNVQAIAVFDDGTGPALFAGGRFTTAGGVPVNRIAKWSGGIWSALEGPSGIGTNDSVDALTVFNDGSGAALYVGGRFRMAGGLASSRFGKYAACWPPDTTAPTNPTVQATAPPESIWSNDATVLVTFSGATDEPGGSGLAGYSVLFDQSTATMPDTTVEIAHTSDLHAATSDPLSDADGWYFHLSTCDVAGNCSSAIHAGPFRIDTAQPSAPGPVTSPSHDGGPTNDSMIEIEWTAATDPLSGVAGYRFDFTEVPADPACGSLSSTTTSTSATSAALADGIWYAHVCAVDNAGNFGEVTSGGPYEIDTTAAAVESVGSVPDTGDGVLAGGEELLGGTTQLLVRWSDAMADPAGDSDPEDVTNPANYRLVGAGPDGAIVTGVCAPLAGDDVEWPFTAAEYDALNESSALRFAGSLALPAQLYRFAICDSLEDDAGNPVAASSIDFRILGSDLLAQPNFDDDLAGWTVSDPFPGSLQWSPDDAGGEASSGSAEIVTANGAGAVWSLSQCVAVDAPRWLGRLRTRSASSTPDQPEVSVRVEWFSGADCGGAGLGAAAAPPVTGDTGDEWIESVHDGGVPPGATSARVAAVVTGGTAPSFTVAVDDLFHGNPFTIFVDGFETGTTEWWSATVP